MARLITKANQTLLDSNNRSMLTIIYCW